MRIRASLLGAAAAAAAFSVFAQGGAAGKWNASVDTPQGPFAFSFNFTVEGNTLTGNMTNDFMGATPISDGTINGDSVAFKLSFAGPEGTMTINYTGVVKGEELVLTSKFEGAPPGGGPAEQTLTATRAK